MIQKIIDFFLFLASFFRKTSSSNTESKTLEKNSNEFVVGPLGSSSKNDSKGNNKSNNKDGWGFLKRLVDHMRKFFSKEDVDKVHELGLRLAKYMRYVPETTKERPTKAAQIQTQASIETHSINKG